jgi:6-phosphogluconolactonase
VAQSVNAHAPRPRVFADAAGVADAAARLVVAAAAKCIDERGEFRLVVPGGRSIAGVFDRLAREPERDQVDWRRVTLLFADERAVPPDHPDSNYRLARVALLDPLGDPLPRVRRMRGEAADLEAAAREYHAELAVPADLVVLGLGEDGHIASLFPGSPLLDEHWLRVAVTVDSPKPPPRRITLTPRALLDAREGLLVLATGTAKGAAARAALTEATDFHRLPARLARDAVWLLDAAAVGGKRS